MTMLTLALAFAVVFGFGVVGLLFGGEILRGPVTRKLTFAVAWGVVTVVAYGAFVMVIWPVA